MRLKVRPFTYRFFRLPPPIPSGIFDTYPESMAYPAQIAHKPLQIP